MATEPQSEKTLSPLGCLAILLAPLVVLAALFAGFIVYSTHEQRWLQSELDHVADRDRPSPSLAPFSLICFNSNNGSERTDFAKAARAAGSDVDDSLRQCGADKSCCGLNSDVAGIVGLVRDNEIRCVTARFVYVLQSRREACIPPNRLRVQRMTFKEHFRLPGRPWIGNPGNSFYQVDEQQP